MNQRQSVINSFFATDLTNSGKYTVAIFLARYMLCSGAAETPLLFLEKDSLKDSIRDAYDYAVKLNSTPIEEIPSQLRVMDDLEVLPESETQLVDAMSTLSVMHAACIIQFENGNTVLVVGTCKNGYYFIDVSNEVFFHTPAPEYDIESYADQYGDKDFKITYYGVKGEFVTPPLPLPPTPITEPKVKKPSKKKIKVAEPAIEIKN